MSLKLDILFYASPNLWTTSLNTNMTLSHLAGYYLAVLLGPDYFICNAGNNGALKQRHIVSATPCSNNWDLEDIHLNTPTLSSGEWGGTDRYISNMPSTQYP